MAAHRTRRVSKHRIATEQTPLGARNPIMRAPLSFISFTTTRTTLEVRTMQQITTQLERKTRRDRGTIILDIMRVLSEKERKFTHLLYKSNLSCDRLRHYLGELIGQGLVEARDNVNGALYGLTDKGKQAYFLHSPFIDFLHSLER